MTNDDELRKRNADALRRAAIAIETGITGELLSAVMMDAHRAILEAVRSDARLAKNA